MLVHRLTTPGLAIHSYIVADLSTKEGIVIDPTRNVDEIVKFIDQEGLQILYIFETHVHADFISGSKELKERLPNKPIICCSGLGGIEWSPKYADRILKDKEEISVGSFRIQIWHTPGHTPEHLMYVIFDQNRDSKDPCFAFTGDFLFVGSVGRPDLLGEKALSELSKQLYGSIFKRLPLLPDYIQIFPGHGAGSACGSRIDSTAQSTLGYERRANPLLIPKEENSWVSFLLQNMPHAPAYFTRLKKWNLSGVSLIRDLPHPKKMNIQEIAKLDPKKNFILDARSLEEFAEKHLPNSINLGLGNSLSKWVPEFVPYDMPIYLILKDEEQLVPVCAALHLVGLDQIEGFALFDENAVSCDSLTLCPLEELLNKDENLYLVDIRTQPEWEAGHIKEATHIELGTLPKSLDLLPKDKEIALICRSGYRSSLAASLLRKKGFKNVSNVKGGMQGWLKAMLPIMKN